MRRALLLSSGLLACVLGSAAGCGGDETSAPQQAGVGGGGGQATVACIELPSRWAASFGGVGRVSLYDAALDADGALLVAGAFAEELDIGGEVVSADVTDGFVIKLDPDGAAEDAPAWRAHFGGSEMEHVHAVAGSSAGGAVVAGYYSGELSIDETTLSSVDASNDAYLGVLTDSGGVDWLTSFGDLANQRGGQHLLVDADGNIALFGTFRDGVLDFADGVSVSSPDDGRYTIFVARFDATGKPLWARSYGDVAENVFRMAGMVADEDGNLYVAGSFDQTLPPLFGDMPAQGATDSFVAKLDGEGTVLWSALMSGQFPGLAEVQDIALSGDMVVLTGRAAGVFWTQGSLQGSDGLSDAFLVSVSADDGSLRTSRLFGGEGLSSGAALQPLADGNVALAGRFERGVDISCAETDEHTGMFVSVVDPALGALLGGAIYPGLFGQLELVATADELLVVGEFRGDAEMGGIALESSDLYATDIAVAALPLPEPP